MRNIWEILERIIGKRLSILGSGLLVFQFSVLCELKHVSIILHMLVPCTQHSDMFCANFNTQLFIRFAVLLSVSVVLGKLKYASQFPVRGVFINT